MPACFSALLSLTFLAVWAAPASPAGDVWVEVLSPHDGAALYSADESTRIEYRTSSLPVGALVRLSINGHEALRNPNTEVAVDVPGLIVGLHEVSVEVLDAGGAPLAARRVHFEMRHGYSWVAKHVVLADAVSAATCSAADVCNFLIDARGDGSSPASGHFFRVRLVGPAIVMGSIQELNTTSGVYEVTYRAVDAGLYSMSVLLMHASNTGLADPGEGIPRQFLNQHIHESPLLVRVTPAAQLLPTDSSGNSPRSDEDRGSWAVGDMFRPPLDAASPLCPGMRRYARLSTPPLGPPWSEGRWVHRHVCLWQGDWCDGVGSDRVDKDDAPQHAQDPWIWVPHGCVLRRYDADEAHKCIAQAWWTGAAKTAQAGQGTAPGAPRCSAGCGTGKGWWKHGVDGRWLPGNQEAPNNHSLLDRPPPSTAPARLYLSGTSLVRTMFYDIVCLLDPACNASKEHEDLGYAAGDSGVRVAFHWFARFADHVLFTDPPLGRVDDRTGRLAFNTTLTDLLHSIGTEADSPDSIVVLGSQIFDILKAPLADYASNLALLIQHVIPKVKGTVMWRTGEALHDCTLDAGWDFGANPGRYMNDPRMQEANRIAVKMMREAGVGILDLHALTHGREDRSHDGTHYWNQKILHETESKVRKGNGVSFTGTQLLLNWLCNP